MARLDAGEGYEVKARSPGGRDWISSTPSFGVSFVSLYTYGRDVELEARASQPPVVHWSLEKGVHNHDQKSRPFLARNLYLRHAKSILSRRPYAPP